MTTPVYHPSSTVHTAVPLILPPGQTDWPQHGDPIYITKSRRAFFMGRPVCQIGTEGTDQYLGICVNNVNPLNDITSVNSVIRFFSVILRGLCYKEHSILITSPEMLKHEQWPPV